MIQMFDEKFFYKYQSLEIIKDKTGKDRQYAIENLASNQLYFQHPKEYNDPYDSVIHYYKESTVKATIDKWMKRHGFTREKAIDVMEKEVKERIIKRDGDLLRVNCYGRDFLPLPLTCCFSDKNDNILMWSHYAKDHKGVCLRFKSKLIEGVPYLTVNSKAVRLHPINYDLKSPDPINYHNQIEEQGQISKFLSTKSSDWIYESEYRMFLPKEMPRKNLNEFKKEELEGVILGMKMNYFDASEIYETINEHYLRKGINVNFYVADFVPSEYKAPPKKIEDIEKHLQNLLGRMQLEEQSKHEQRFSNYSNFDN